MPGVRGELREARAFNELCAREEMPQMQRTEGREAPLSFWDSDLWLHQ